MEHEEEIFDQLLASRNSYKNRQLLNVFWIGFIIYIFGYTLSVGPDPNYMICDLLRLVGITLFVISSTLMIALKFESKYLALLFHLFIFWQFFVVLRGVEMGYEEIKNILFNPLNGMFLYITPLILLFPRNPHSLKIIFKVIAAFGILFFVGFVLMYAPIIDRDNVDGRDIFEVLVKVMAFPTAFLLMTYNFQSNNKKLLAIAVILVSLALAAFRVRRGLIFIIGCALILTFLIFLYINKRQSVLVILSIFAGFLMSIIGLGAFGNSDIEFVNRIKERLEEDTRSEVELYYYADMEAKDWLIGRGMSGLVAAPPGIDSSGDTSGYRDGIETDYLNTILKGGSIGLGLLLLIAVPAMLNGLFFSNNSLAKAAGFWILLWIISLYPTTVTTFSMNYILVWVSIGICYSPIYRRLSEETLINYFKGKFEPILDEQNTIQLNDKST
ncbi:hypothetical protein JQC67_06690 [Aurantibacter crassamenti]|uniref:hypothetical protein n=1 Tax=Aurantibacter crassamenti TaxID=1837375 RepID=UPI00193AD982|nr:hypothetical protein [Aurantibacter crassamenti]MBM1105816.1 hypothetical protein [Aurantibacter crassamenti]